MFVWISLAAVVVAVFLGWTLCSRFGADRIAALNEKRRATSKLVSRGEAASGVAPVLAPQVASAT